MLLKKLPDIFKQDNLMVQMAKLFEGKKVMFSSSVYCEDGNFKAINKPSGKPIFEKDRFIYSMMRGMSKTLITSSHNLTSEKDTFKVHYARGDKDIEKMYDNLRDNQKQNVFVMTEKNKEEDIKKYINPDLYNFLGKESLKKHEGKSFTLTQVLNDLWETNLTPILIECGPTIMNEYWQKSKTSQDPHHIELLYFASFEGKMKKQYIGEELHFDKEHYKKVWQSQKIDTKDDMEDKGKLCLKVYEWKKD